VATTPPCTLAAEHIVYDVADGVAVVADEISLRSASPVGGCSLELAASMHAREEGRSPPEVAAWALSRQGAKLMLGGPNVPVSVVLPEGTSRARIDVVLRVERLVIAPLSLAGPDGAMITVRPLRQDRTSWSYRPIAATVAMVRRIDHGVPVVAQVDLSKTDAPATLRGEVTRGSFATLAIDAGAPDDAGGADGGGAQTAAIFLNDLPLAIANAASDDQARERLVNLAALARQAASARDPLLAVIGARTISLLDSGLTHCARKNGPKPIDVHVALPADALEAEGACPAFASLVTTSHPDLALADACRSALQAAHGVSADPLHDVRFADNIFPTAPPTQPQRTVRRLGMILLLSAALGGLAALLRLES